MNGSKSGMPAEGRRSAALASETEQLRLQLETIANNATLALFIMDERQFCSYMNPAAERLTGFTLQELQGKPLHEYVHHTRPDGTPYPLEECPIDQAFPTNLREQGEEMFVHRDGHFYPVAFTASPIRDGARTVGTIIEVRDITLERQAEAERERLLRRVDEDRRRLFDAFHNAPAMMVVVRGPDHVFEAVNQLYTDFVRRSDLIGQPAAVAMPELVQQGFIDLLDEVYRSGEPFVGTEVPVVLHRENGALETRYVNFVYQPLRAAEGEVYGILGHGVDVTPLVESRRRAERQATELELANEELEAQAFALEEVQMELEISNAELAERNQQLQERAVETQLARAAAEAARDRLSRVFSQVPAAVGVLLGPEHVVQSVNEMFLRLLGRRDYVGRCAYEAAPELEAQGFRALMDEVYRTGVPFIATEAPLTWDRDGTGTLHQGFFNFVYQPIMDSQGQVEGILVFAVEVTDQVHAREAVELARAEAEAANQAKSEFLAIMSHELRTPLNAIGGYAELIALGIRGPVSDQQREDLGRIEASQRHLLGLINDVLNYARLETGTVRYDITHVPVREVLVAADGLVAPQAGAKRITFTIGDVPPELHIRADAEKLRQILVNLISNAVKFTEPGGRIEVDCRTSGDRVLITVRDTGIGIAAEKQGVIFDPFVQVRSDLARTADGTGLGLAISRDLAHGMGGDLSVESALGAGSAFTLSLPIGGDSPPSAADISLSSDS